MFRRTVQTTAGRSSNWTRLLLLQLLLLLLLEIEFEEAGAESQLNNNF
jgi:hypothetical protein